MPSGGNPKPLHRLRHNPADDGGIDVAVREEGGQIPSSVSICLNLSTAD